MKTNFATPTPFGTVSCFVIGICQSNYNLNSFLMHQASYSIGYQWYLIHKKVLGCIQKIGRYPIKVSEVLSYSQIINNKTFLFKTKVYSPLCYLCDILHYYPISWKLLWLSFLLKCLLLFIGSGVWCCHKDDKLNYTNSKGQLLFFIKYLL